MYYHGGEKGLKIFLVIMAVVIIMLFVSPAILFLQLINAQEQDTKRQLETEILILETENAQLREMLSIMQGERDKLQGELTRKIEQWLQLRNYEDSSGEKKQAVEVVAERVVFIGGKRQDNPDVSPPYDDSDVPF